MRFLELCLVSKLDLELDFDLDFGTIGNLVGVLREFLTRIYDVLFDLNSFQSIKNNKKLFNVRIFKIYVKRNLNYVRRHSVANYS